MTPKTYNPNVPNNIEPPKRIIKNLNTEIHRTKQWEKSGTKFPLKTTARRKNKRDKKYLLK